MKRNWNFNALAQINFGSGNPQLQAKEKLCKYLQSFNLKILKILDYLC
jgi:hypothetical protein